MDDGVLWVTGVLPAECFDHADVVLSRGGREEGRVRIDAQSARAICAELNGLCSEHGLYLDVLRVALEASGAGIEAVEVSPGAHGPQGRIYLEGPGAPRGIRGLPAGFVLLVSARLEVPVRLAHAPAACAPAEPSEPAGPDIPEPFRAFLSQLDLGDGRGIESRAAHDADA